MTGSELFQPTSHEHHDPPRTGHTGRAKCLTLLKTNPWIVPTRLTVHALFGCCSCVVTDQYPPEFTRENDVGPSSKQAVPSLFVSAGGS